MNPNYTEFRFPIIKPCPWNKVCNFYSDTPFVSFTIFKLIIVKRQRKEILILLEMCLGLAPHTNELNSKFEETFSSIYS